MPPPPSGSILSAAQAEITREVQSMPVEPANQIQIGAVATQQDAGIVAEADEQLGKGFEAVQQASYLKRAGWKVGGWVKWAWGGK